MNTWHVETAGAATVAEAEDVAEAVRNFYTIDPPTQVEAIMDLFGDQVALTGHEIRVYPIDEATGVNLLGDGEPPLWVEAFDHLGRSAADSGPLPSEVALCLSFRNTTAGAVPQRRRRGRLYLGPFKASVVVGTGTATPRPTVGVLDLAIDAAKAVKTALTTAGGTWVVYSRPYAGRALGDEVRHDGTPLPAIPARPGATYEVNVAWVDDSFDTQRRRGEASVSRQTESV